MAENPDQPHNCIVCPLEVRHLFAVAHNASGSFQRFTRDQEDWTRVVRKMSELAAAVEMFQPIIDRHFAVAGNFLVKGPNVPKA